MISTPYRSAEIQDLQTIAELRIFNPGMQHGATDTKPSRLVRARSLPSSRPFNVAVFFSALQYMGMITTLTAFILFFYEPSQLATQVIIGSMVFSAVMWLIAFFKRRSACCPLCKGTPLINSGALAHSRATRIFPFSHGVSATLSIMATATKQ